MFIRGTFSSPEESSKIGKYKQNYFTTNALNYGHLVS